MDREEIIARFGPLHGGWDPVSRRFLPHPNQIPLKPLKIDIPNNCQKVMNNDKEEPKPEEEPKSAKKKSKSPPMIFGKFGLTRKEYRASLKDCFAIKPNPKFFEIQNCMNIVNDIFGNSIFDPIRLRPKKYEITARLDEKKHLKRLNKTIEVMPDIDSEDEDRTPDERDEQKLIEESYGTFQKYCIMTHGFR